MKAGTAKIDLTPQPAAGVFMTGYTNYHDNCQGTPRFAHPRTMKAVVVLKGEC